MLHPPRSSQTRTALPRALIRVELGLGVFSCLSLLFMFIERARHIEGLQAGIFSPRVDRFTDFRIFTHKFEFFHTAKFFEVGFPINYPAPCAVFLEVFFRYFHHNLRAFLCFVLLSFLVPAVLFTRALYRRGLPIFHATHFVFVALALSWPFLFLYDRANVEVLVFLLMLIGLWSYATGKESLAAVFFSLGAAAKIFPFVVLGIFVSRRQWGKLLLAALVAIASSIVSLAILGPTIPSATKGLLAGIAKFRSDYMVQWRPFDSGTDHSFFGLYKDVQILFHHSVQFPRALSLYLTLAAIGGVLLYVIRIRSLPLMNQVLIFTIVSITFTAFSADYTLVQLYGPFCLLVLLTIEAEKEGRFIPGLSFILGCFTFLFSVMTFLVYRGQRFIGPFKCIGLAVLMIAALRFPLGPPIAETESGLVLSRPGLGWLRP